MSIQLALSLIVIAGVLIAVLVLNSGDREE